MLLLPFLVFAFLTNISDSVGEDVLPLGLPDVNMLNSSWAAALREVACFVAWMGCSCRGTEQPLTGTNLPGLAA